MLSFEHSSVPYNNTCDHYAEESNNLLIHHLNSLNIPSII